MRLWHYQLLPYLPKSQLLSQKRECDLIWKDIKEGKQTNHILINYIWNYKNYTIKLGIYYMYLKNEFIKRGYKFKNNSIFNDYDLEEEDNYSFQKCVYNGHMPFKEHNIYYLLQCYFNLEEKFHRGQKDFSKKEFDKLFNFVDEYSGFALTSMDYPENRRS